MGVSQSSTQHPEPPPEAQRFKVDFPPRNTMESAKIFWLMPVHELMSLPDGKPMPCHQDLLRQGKLVQRRVTMEDVMTGGLSKDVCAISHRWLHPEHFDPQGHKMRKLKQIMAQLPSIQFVWLDWACAPQEQNGARTAQEKEEFEHIRAHVLSYMYLGATVIVLWDLPFNQRFWPNVESWTAMQKPTSDGLKPATGEDARAHFFGMRLHDGEDKEIEQSMLDRWQMSTAEGAVEILKGDGFLAKNMEDKEIGLKVIASLDDQVREIFSASKSPSVDAQVIGAPQMQNMMDPDAYALAVTPAQTAKTARTPRDGKRFFPRYISAGELEGAWAWWCVPFPCTCCSCILESYTAVGEDELERCGCLMCCFVCPCIPLAQVWVRVPGTNLFENLESGEDFDEYHSGMRADNTMGLSGGKLWGKICGPGKLC